MTAWFERHLHWTYVLSWVLAFVIALVFGFMWGMIDPVGVMNATQGTFDMIGYLIALLIITPAALWVLHRKNRSWCWVFLQFVPIAWISIFILENKREQV